MMPILDTGVWTPFLGKDPKTLALPDYQSNYFAYGFDWKKDPTLGLRITGDFGYARYMSYNIYPELGGNSLYARMDVEIDAQTGNVNPFKPGEDPNALNRQYTVNVFCPGYASGPTNSLPNKLTFGSEQVKTAVVVILRYYLPTDSDSALAGVLIPTIQAFDTVTSLPLQLPENLVPTRMPKPIYQEQMAPIFLTVVDNTLRFYHVSGSGEFNNNDNLYLMCAVNKQSDEVLLLKFQAPVYGTSNNQYPKAEVRYWSLNEGNVDTSTPWGTPDYEFKPAKDGLTYVAIGAERIRDWAKKGGYNFMPWKAAPGKAVVLYRNLVTNSDFDDSIDKVPVLEGLHEGSISTREKTYALDAKLYIKSYAPTGIKTTEAAFMKNYGGMPSPGFKD